jgi:hypothetical protein
MKTKEQKIAQRFVILAYQRLRLNRYWRKNFVKHFPDSQTYLESENEAHNHLQIAKQIYYSL